MSTPEPTYYPPPPSGPGLKIPILFGAVIALIAANIYLFVQLDHTRTDMSKMRDSLLTEIAGVRETTHVSSQTARKNLETLQEDLAVARRQAASAAGQAKVEATKHAEDLAKRLQKEQATATQAVKSEISEVRQSTTEKIGAVSTEVGTVKTDVASAKSEIDKTIADLKRVTGDLGETSGLVATNGKEIAALRALGDRNIFEFTIAKSKQAQKVGDITIQLRKVDQKRNRYTIDLVADDKKVEKKDKNVNEPVQFYVAKARQPYEIVVNTVGKDKIAGYLATPKVQNPR
jgi:hypothetical protein